jgi:hypothetical protein
MLQKRGKSEKLQPGITEGIGFVNQSAIQAKIKDSSGMTVRKF